MSKSSDECDKLEILAWVGGGRYTNGKWKLTEDQVKLFGKKKGVIHIGKPRFRWTKWEISEHGYMRWDSFSSSRKKDVLEDPEMEVWEEGSSGSPNSIEHFLEENPEFEVKADLTIRFEH